MVCITHKNYFLLCQHPFHLQTIGRKSKRQTERHTQRQIHWNKQREFVRDKQSNKSEERKKKFTRENKGSLRERNKAKEVRKAKKREETEGQKQFKRNPLLFCSLKAQHLSFRFIAIAKGGCDRLGCHIRGDARTGGMRLTVTPAHFFDEILINREVQICRLIHKRQTANVTSPV